MGLLQFAKDTPKVIDCFLPPIDLRKGLAVRVEEEVPVGSAPICFAKFIHRRRLPKVEHVP